MTTLEYIYKVAEVVKITDGDTYWLRLDTGFRNLHLTNLRLLGVDCPESNRGSAFEKRAGAEARQLVIDWFTLAPISQVWVRTEKDPDSFGRWLGKIWMEDPTGRIDYLADALLAERLATIWPTRWRETYDDR